MFDSFSLCQTNVSFSKTGSIKKSLWLQIKWPPGQTYYDYRKKIIVLLTVLSSASKFLLHESKVSTAREILFLKSRPQLENSVEI